jgi:hypothetical protein
MSTKTTFKRVALVAVAALGFGVLTSVAPASAGAGTNNDNITAISAGTSGPARVLVSSGATTITVTHAETTGDVGVDTVTAQITSAPTGSLASVLTFSASAESLGGPNGTGTFTASTKTDQLTTANAGVAVAVFSPNRLATVKTTKLSLRLNADVAGTYTILVTADAASAAGYSAGKLSTAYTITTAGAPTVLTAAAVAGTVTTLGLGQIFSLSMKDAAGNATILGLNEAILVSDNSDATTLYKETGASNTTVASSFGSTDTNVAGAYYVRAAKTGALATGTAVLTFAGSGLLLPSLTVNVTETLQATATELTGSTAKCTTATSCTGVTASGNQAISTSGAQSLTFTNTAAFGLTTAATYHQVYVINAAGLQYSSFATVALNATTASLTAAFTAPAPATGATTSVILGGTTAVMTYVAATASTIAVSGSTSVLSATAGATTWAIYAADTYGNAAQYVPVSVTVAGRNTVATKALGVTDVNGFITYTLTDAGTTGTSDTLTFSSTAGPASVTASVTYGTVTVAKVSFSGGGTLKGVAPVTATVNALKSGDTPEASAQSASVVLTDASGNLLAGVPVVWTVSGTTAAINSTMVTTYSTSAGVATSSVYAWVAGTYTVTATAGGITGTGTYTFANSDATTARVISATADGGIVSAKVVDRFGNPVSGVTVYASRVSGTGYFGTGVTKTPSTTGVDGIAEFILNGTAEIKVSTLDYNAVAGTNAPGQTCALAGNLTCALGVTAAVAFTATTAGTTTLAAANVGSTFAPAGVSSVTVAVNNNAAADSSQAAADAAAEATDAANAATDAANAAAEAADAATAAAQDAADAVAALSTQVSEMVSALKKQITALTNLVIKIQKKVKA